MTRIECKNIVKKYGENTIIPNLNLEIKEGEFFTLIGPSGCGKTTLLRMIAGFNTIEGGTISFNGKEINNIPPSKRNIGMVFQNYAVFPHMSVKKNVAFGLTNRKLSKDEINKRVDKVLKSVKMDNLKDRMPANMSGGQQQRIALARAIVIEPDVLLMDEPLSNLDAKLRVEMRTVIRNIQQDVKITTVYVTHDQEEAMAVSDRIAVMKDGIIQQVGTAREIYSRPSNLFVATFIGNTNILDGALTSKGDYHQLTIENYTIDINNLDPAKAKDGKVKVSIRPEDFKVVLTGEAGIKGTVKESVFLGANTHYTVELESGNLVDIVQESSDDEPLKKGMKVTLIVNGSKINIYNEAGDCNYYHEVKCHE